MHIWGRGLNTHAHAQRLEIMSGLLLSHSLHYSVEKGSLTDLGTRVLPASPRGLHPHGSRVAGVQWPGLAFWPEF